MRYIADTGGGTTAEPEHYPVIRPDTNARNYALALRHARAMAAVLRAARANGRALAAYMRAESGSGAAIARYEAANVRLDAAVARLEKVEREVRGG